jgi:hypothetical protein
MPMETNQRPQLDRWARAPKVVPRQVPGVQAQAGLPALRLLLPHYLLLLSWLAAFALYPFTGFFLTISLFSAFDLGIGS